MSVVAADVLTPAEKSVRLQGAAGVSADTCIRARCYEKTHAFLKEFQKPNGYLSTYAKEDFLRKNPENPDAEQHWCFNIWGRKYTLWALVEILRSGIRRQPFSAAA